MNTQLKTNIKGQLKLINKLIISLLLAASSSAYATGSYQLKVLLTPSDSNLQAESKGRVMIYDGLKSGIINLAMNDQFDRIESMMFVNTQYLQEDGEYETEDEDEDC